MPSIAASIQDMTSAVANLGALEKRRLADLEELTYRLGVEPGADLAFAGVRVLLGRAEAAASFLAALAPHEADLRAWLAQRIARRVEAIVSSHELV